MLIGNELRAGSNQYIATDPNRTTAVNQGVAVELSACAHLEMRTEGAQIDAAIERHGVTKDKQVGTGRVNYYPGAHNASATEANESGKLDAGGQGNLGAQAQSNLQCE
jgi:hypothetical protein